ncbi:hypothetical protein CYY_008168 [Polysphondylium violaceum]|uniref:Uncharacterized protein n=1 Tax=Polysphondylium violaceum TaxID=133409 RepID=A0A8J4PP57_9MYCE|nr:hypothetical protein CYY_008168 [Polysphondylium violaceum]
MKKNFKCDKENPNKIIQFIGEPEFLDIACQSISTIIYISTNENEKLNSFEKRSKQTLHRKGLIPILDSNNRIKFPTQNIFDPYSLFLISSLDSKSYQSNLYKEKVDKQLDYHPILSWIDVLGATRLSSVVYKINLIDSLFIQSFKQGIKQYVHLGSGFSTRGQRMNFDSTCTFYELDLPSTLTYKNKVFHKANIEFPNYGDQKLIQISCNLFNTKWIDQLVDSDFNPNLPTFWLVDGLFFNLDFSTIMEMGSLINSISCQKSKFFIQTLFNRNCLLETPNDDKYQAINVIDFLTSNGFGSNIQEFSENGNDNIYLYSTGNKT